MTGNHSNFNTIRISVPDPLGAHVGAAVTRLGYLYPSVVFAVVDGAIEASSDRAVDASALQRDIRYALYREKIYAETLALRHSLVDAVTRR